MQNTAHCRIWSSRTRSCCLPLYRLQDSYKTAHQMQSVVISRSLQRLFSFQRRRALFSNGRRFAVHQHRVRALHGTSFITRIAAAGRGPPYETAGCHPGFLEAKSRSDLVTSAMRRPGGNCRLRGVSRSVDNISFDRTYVHWSVELQVF